MNLDDLRNEYSRLMDVSTIKDCIEALEIYERFYLSIISSHHSQINNSIQEKQAKLVLQMMLTKNLHLKTLLSGVDLKTELGQVLKNIIDPTIIASFIRNIYETVCMFNIIYQCNKNDARTIVYNLWVHSGLKYRQRFETNITTQENRQKLANEKKEIETLINEIENTELYKNLDAKNQKKIQTQIKEKAYLIRFQNYDVEILNWQSSSSVMGVKTGFFDNMYTYFSLYSHPSNVAVFQFGEMFSKNEDEYINLTAFHLRNFFLLSSIFIADYLNLFPQTLKSFETLPVLDQIVINTNNILTRGYDYSINDTWKKLG